MSICRRTFLGWLGAGGAMLRAAEAPFPFVRLDHVEFTVADVRRTRDFYARLFGAAVMKNNRTERRYVRLGAAYFAFEPAPPARMDHFSVGIRGYDVAAIRTFLKERDIAYRDFPSGRDLNVTDPDGTRMQLSAEEGWTALTGGTASPEGINAAEPLAKATGVNHILLNVADLVKAQAFYEQVLGSAVERTADRVWFELGASRLGLRTVPAGEEPGVAYLAIGVEKDPALPQKLAAVVKLEGGLGFRDPDGFQIRLEQ